MNTLFTVNEKYIECHGKEIIAEVVKIERSKFDLVKIVTLRINGKEYKGISSAKLVKGEIVRDIIHVNTGNQNLKFNASNNYVSPQEIAEGMKPLWAMDKEMAKRAIIDHYGKHLGNKAMAILAS